MRGISPPQRCVSYHMHNLYCYLIVRVVLKLGYKQVMSLGDGAVLTFHVSLLSLFLEIVSASFLGWMDARIAPPIPRKEGPLCAL